MITILGASGFIGSSLVKKLQEKNIPFEAPLKGEDLNNKNWGDIIYCIGLTADFRQKPFETVEAHVCLINYILKNIQFESITYLSSTRVYLNSNEEEVFENSPINISITNPDELYTLTKLTGERLCLSSGRKVRIVRLSNVYGNDYSSENFINNIINKIKENAYVDFFTTLSSAKDYISIDSLTDILIDISTKGKDHIYNVASGENISNADIIEMLKLYFNFKFSIDGRASEIIFPKINIEKIKKEFGFLGSDKKTNLLKLIKIYTND